MMTEGPPSVGEVESRRDTACATSEPLDVLVADDDVATRRGLALAVRQMGHRCREAADGAEAWRMLQARRADVILSDWNMPGLTGAELCARTRVVDEEEPYTYFILMTGYADREHLLAGMKAGADDYQKKPIDLNELEARLVSAARVIALHRRLAERTETLRRDSKTFFAASRTDPLTGTGNRLALKEEIDVIRSRADRYGHKYALAMCDVDFFKPYNDAFGHIAGDEALRRIADAMRGTLRAGDRVYRYGGEEFVILLHEQGAEEAKSAVERVRAAVEAMAIPSAAPGKVLTLSAGIAELSLADASRGAWIARADAALYAAKSRGRNRVEVLGA